MRRSSRRSAKEVKYTENGTDADDAVMHVDEAPPSPAVNKRGRGRKVAKEGKPGKAVTKKKGRPKKVVEESEGEESEEEEELDVDSDEDFIQPKKKRSREPAKGKKVGNAKKKGKGAKVAKKKEVSAPSRPSRSSGRVKNTVKYTEVGEEDFESSGEEQEEEEEVEEGKAGRQRPARTKGTVKCSAGSASKKSQRAKSSDPMDEDDEDEEEAESRARRQAEEEDDDVAPLAGAVSAAPILKLEKLLAYSVLSKEDWIAKGKAHNTSKVKGGRRVEILKWEKEVEKSMLKDVSDAKERKRIRRERRKKLKSKSYARKNETRYLVKWLRESFFHSTWETAKSLKSYLGDDKLVNRHIRKLEKAFTMMDEEEFGELQKVDRIVDYNIFVEEVPVPKAPQVDGGKKEAPPSLSAVSDSKNVVADEAKSSDAKKDKEKEHEKNESGNEVGSDDEEEEEEEEDEDDDHNKNAEEFTQVQRWEYLVKWKSQGYEDATWELAIDIESAPGVAQAIARHDALNSEENIASRGKLGTKDKNYRSSQTFKSDRKLRSYQVDAVNWLTYNFSQDRGSILADEMGLGKTCQTVTFCHRLRNAQGVSGPFLIVAPLATLPHWQREFDAWTDFNCITYHGAADGRELMRRKEFFWEEGKRKGPGGMPKFDALVTNYETILSDVNYLARFKWSLLVVDEAHRLKNRESRLTVCLRDTFRFGATLLLTGTPIQNSLPELFTLLNFIAKKDFPKLEAFKEKYDGMESAKEMEAFHERLRPFMLRRIKAEVEPLPDREDTLIEVELTTLQKRFYRAIYEKNTAYLLAGVEKGARISLNNVAMELRKCCCHPYLIDGVESKILKDSPVPADVSREQRLEHVFGKLVESSGKLILLDKLLPKLKEEGHRVLIFSQMTRMLDILEDYLMFRNYAYERIDGSVRGVDRQFAIDRFSANKSQSFAFLLSTRGCGQGINLTAADTVIMYDGDWNPQNDVQALARCHRIGQTKKVMVYRLITRKTYEQTMFQRASMKLGLDQAVMQGITAGGEDEKDSAEKRKKGTKSKKEQDQETERLLRYGAYAITAEEDDAEATSFVNADIDEILSSRAKVMQTDREENRLSKATFVDKNNDTTLDIDDPDFWTKVVGLKEEDEELELSRGDRRRNKINLNEDDAERDFLRDLRAESDDEEDDDAVATGKIKDEDASGRKLVFRKHFFILRDCIETYGYGHWKESFTMLNERFPGRWMQDEVVALLRGFAVFFVLRRPSEKEKDKDGSESDSGSDSGSELSSETESKDDTVDAGKSARISDFQLVNMSSRQAAKLVKERVAFDPECSVYRLRVIPDLEAGREFIIPDVLVTRMRLATHRPVEKDIPATSLPSADVIEDDWVVVKRESIGDQETVNDPSTREPPASASASVSAPGPTSTSPSTIAAAVPKVETMATPSSEPDIATLIDSASDDSDLDDVARKVRLKQKRGPAYREEVATRVVAFAAKSIRNLDKLSRVYDIVKRQRDQETGALKMEGFPNITGALPSKWWTPADDLNLLAGVAKYGWDTRKERNVFVFMRYDPNLSFNGVVRPESELSEGKRTGSADDIEADALALAAIANAAAAAAKPDGAEGEANATVTPSKTPTPSGAVTPTPNGDGFEDPWPSVHKLALRTKRITDWFRVVERRALRSQESRRHRRGDGVGGVRVLKPPEISTEWLKSEKKAAYRGLLRYGMPVQKEEQVVFGMTVAAFRAAANLQRKTPELVEEFLKIFVSDAAQLRVNSNMKVKERNAEILNSSTSAKKLIERIKILSDLRAKVLPFAATPEGKAQVIRLITKNRLSFDQKKKTKMAKWWTIEHDMALLRGCAKWGVGSMGAQEDIRSDPELPFAAICVGVDGEWRKPGKKKDTNKDEADDGDDDAEEEKSENVAPTKTPPTKKSGPLFPSVVDSMNRLRALTDIIVRFYGATYFRKTIKPLPPAKVPLKPSNSNANAGDELGKGDGGACDDDVVIVESKAIKKTASESSHSAMQTFFKKAPKLNGSDSGGSLSSSKSGTKRKSEDDPKTFGQGDTKKSCHGIKSYFAPKPSAAD